jgi:hypothetical protein
MGDFLMTVADTDTNTPPSSLALLDFDLALTQNQAMTAREFGERAGEMGLSIDVAGLESLHRSGVLFPLLGVDQSVSAVRRQTRHLDVGVAEQFVHLKDGDWYRDVRMLLAARDDGDVFDPATVVVRPWKRQSHFRDLAISRIGYIYSAWQLLQLRHVLNSCPHGDPKALERSARRREFWRVILESLQREGLRFRRLSLLLAALEAAYIPQMEGRLVGFFEPGEWETYRRSFDPAVAIGRLGWKPGDVAHEGEMLLGQASLFDPLAKWTDLVGLALPARRLELRGLARLAVEYRRAAEVLLACHADLVASGVAEERPAPPEGWWHPVRDRLEAKRSLDAVLTRYGLSPHPSVLVVVEGKTERSFVRRYLDHHFSWDWRIAIQLLDAEGVDNDVTAAAAVFAPRPGRIYNDLVLLERPLTRILVITDPEGHHATDKGREAARLKWRERMRRALPTELQHAVLDEDLDRLVEFDVPSAAFEYAHFTDEEIADAIVSVSTSPSVPARAELAEAVRVTREAGKGLKTLWKTWQSPEPNKVRIAESLFPDLTDRVDAALRSGSDEVPIAQSIRRLLQMEAEYPRDGSMALRLRPGAVRPSGDV